MIKMLVEWNGKAVGHVGRDRMEVEIFKKYAILLQKSLTFIRVQNFSK